MKIYDRGFSMIEFLVYLCLFATISSVLMHFVVNTTLALQSQSVELQRTLHFLTAMDLVAHELACANAEKKQWLKADKNLLVWHSDLQKKDICICILDKKLVRIIGTYIPLQNVWSSKTINVITENIQDFTFNFEWESVQEQLNVITFSLTGILNNQKKYSTSRSIRLYNRYI